MANYDYGAANAAYEEMQKAGLDTQGRWNAGKWTTPQPGYAFSPYGEIVKVSDYLGKNQPAAAGPSIQVPTLSGGGLSAPNMSIGGGGAAGADGGGGNASAIYQQAAGAADPFASQRAQYQNQLQNLMQGNFSANDPSYNFRLQQGQQALERSQAAKGYLGSGNVLQALQNYGQGAASQEYQNQYNRLLPLTGATTGSPGGAGAILAQQPQYGLDVYKTAMQATKLPYELQALSQSGQQGALQQNMLQSQYDEMLRQQRLSRQGPSIPIQQQGFLGGGQ